VLITPSIVPVAGEIDRIEAMAQRAQISLATLRKMLRLAKDILKQSLTAASAEDVTAAAQLRAAQDKLTQAATVPAEGVPPAEAETTPPESVPPETATSSPDAAEQTLQVQIITQALLGIKSNTLDMFVEAIKQIQQITYIDSNAGEEIDGNGANSGGSGGADSEYFEGQVLVEIGEDRDIAKRVWMKRWVVVSPGKLEVYFSPDAVTEDDRICMMPLSFVYLQSQPKAPRLHAPHAFRLGVKDVTRYEYTRGRLALVLHSCRLWLCSESRVKP